jgi:hypothetical protein
LADIPDPEPVEGSTQRKVPRGRDDEVALTADLVALAEKYGSSRLTEDQRVAEGGRLVD